jgi:hypothetical protein
VKTIFSSVTGIPVYPLPSKDIGHLYEKPLLCLGFIDQNSISQGPVERKSVLLNNLRNIAPRVLKIHQVILVLKEPIAFGI